MLPTDRRRSAALLLPLLALATMTATVPGCAGSLFSDRPALSDQLPITRVILYQNGIGYFERRGRIEGNVLTLHCRAHQVNDLLKSLTVIDAGSGRAVSVSLPLERSRTQQLGELPRQVRSANGLLDVLRVFRGARVKVIGSRGRVQGRVLGIEEDLLPDSTREKPRTAHRLTLKDESGDLVAYPVHAIRRVVLLDRALEVGLDRSLDVSLEEGTWKPITLSVRLAGPPKHDLLVSYIVEMPLWKPAYRLVLGDGRAGTQPLLQGWAVVDNVSGESWSGVGLSLVAGTPMSFTYDLHSPRFTRRIDLTPSSTTTALAPPRETAGYAAPPPAAASQPSGKDLLQRSYGRQRAAGASSGYYKSKPGAADDESRRASAEEAEKGARAQIERERAPAADVAALERQVQANVQGEQVGSLFRYDLQDPVTVPDSSSTLVAIVNRRVPGDEVVLFRPELTQGHAASHPYRAIMFTNTSGSSLERGPVAIYSRSTFVGEGFLERMEKGSTLFLTYAIDGRVSMTSERQQRQEGVRLVRVSGGQIVSEAMNIDRSVYQVQSRHDRPVVAYVKSARRAGHSLRVKPRGTVETPEATYVPVVVAPGQTAKLEIEWQSPVRRDLAIDSHLATTVLRAFISGGQVPAHLRPVLEKIMGLKERQAQLELEASRVGRLKNELSADQARVRQNLDLLRKVRGNAPLRGKLTTSLARLEEQLSKLTASYVKLDEERAALVAQMRVLIGQVTLEAPTNPPAALPPQPTR